MLSKSVAVAGAGSIIKAAWVLFLFVFAARHVDIAQFSDFSFWLTVSVVVGLLFDFGQQTAILTRSSRSPRVSFAYTRRKLGFSLLVLTGIALVFLIVSLTFELEVTDQSYFVIAVISAFAGSLGILYCIPHRAQQSYEADVRVGLSECAMVLIGCVIVKTQSYTGGLHILIVYGAARIAGAITAAALCSRGLRGLLMPRIPDAVHFRHWSPFFVHLLFGTLIINVDLLIGHLTLSTVDYAIYQAGMRVVHAGNLILTVISNVYIPSWTQSDKQAGYSTTNGAFKRISCLIVGVSLIGIGFLYWAGEMLAVLVFGESFRGLGIYLPFFGLLVALRLHGSFVGVLLSCRNAQRYRSAAAVFGVFLLILLLVPWSGTYSPSYVIAAQLVTHVAMNSYLLYGLRRMWVRR